MKQKWIWSAAHAGVEQNLLLMGVEQNLLLVGVEQNLLLVGVEQNLLYRTCSSWVLNRTCSSWVLNRTCCTEPAPHGGWTEPAPHSIELCGGSDLTGPVFFTFYCYNICNDTERVRGRWRERRRERREQKLRENKDITMLKTPFDMRLPCCSFHIHFRELSA